MRKLQKVLVSPVLCRRWDRLAAGTADEKKEAEQEATDAADDSSGQETAGPAAADEQKEQGEE